MLRIISYKNELKKNEQSKQLPTEGIYLQIGISPSDKANFVAENFLLDSALIGKVPLAVTNELAEKLGLTPTQEAETTVGNNQDATMKVATVDIQLEAIYLRGVPVLIGGVVNTLGYGLMKILNIYFKDGRVQHVEINEDALKNNFDGPA